jgi:hypothetical protein
MSHYVKGQTLQIDLVMDVDITGAGTNWIKYRKPSGTEGNWVASVVSEEDGWLRYILPAASNDESGDWTVWCYVIQADASVLISAPLTIRIDAEGY